MVLTTLHSENKLEKKNPIGEKTGKNAPNTSQGPVAGWQGHVLTVTFVAVTKCSHLCPTDLSLLIFLIVFLLPPGSLRKKQLNEFFVSRALVYYYKFF